MSAAGEPPVYRGCACPHVLPDGEAGSDGSCAVDHRLCLPLHSLWHLLNAAWRLLHQLCEYNACGTPRAVHRMRYIVCGTPHAVHRVQLHCPQIITSFYSTASIYLLPSCLIHHPHIAWFQQMSQRHLVD